MLFDFHLIKTNERGFGIPKITKERIVSNWSFKGYSNVI